MKIIKLFLMLLVQMPIMVFYYLDPTNPHYVLAFVTLGTVFVWLMDNAISVNYYNGQVLNQNFEELLEKIVKVVPKNPVNNTEMDDEI